MDRALYVAMSGAQQILRAQESNFHNIANASTTGFKAQLAQQLQAPIDGAGLPTRVAATSGAMAWDSSAGSVSPTGNPLDVAFGENLWLAVQAPDGSEAYTRAGDLQLDVNGQLRTASGAPVMGDGGPLTLPQSTSVSIAADGTVSVVPLGQDPNTVASVGRLKVVQAQPSQLVRGGDGLMRATPGNAPAPASGDVLSTGVLESSNVSLPEQMASMIELARTFEMQMKVMRSVEENAQASATLMRIG
jgi:flagellar basal-body rod protein FlgF